MWCRRNAYLLQLKQHVVEEHAEQTGASFPRGRGLELPHRLAGAAESREGRGIQWRPPRQVRVLWRLLGRCSFICTQTQ